MISIEHVGSTAVPGLAAKPVIDIDIVVTRPDVAAALAAMERIGFEPAGERGIADRWSLEAPADLRRQYAALKRSLASQGKSMDRYVEGKSHLFAVVLERAGLTPDERRAVELMNRAG